MKDINWPRLIVQVLIACLLVGILLNFLGVDPLDLYRDAWGTILSVFEISWETLGDIVNYILVGAIIVVPIAIIGLLLSLRRSRKQPPGSQPPKGQ
jgi:hypothetical protein